MKAQGKKEEAVELFQQWMQLIDQGKIEEHS
jgi:hypothetical protein